MEDLERVIDVFFRTGDGWEVISADYYVTQFGPDRPNQAVRECFQILGEGRFHPGNFQWAYQFVDLNEFELEVLPFGPWEVLLQQDISNESGVYNGDSE